MAFAQMTVREAIGSWFTNSGAGTYAADCAAYLFGREWVDRRASAATGIASKEQAASHEAGHAVVSALVGMPSASAKIALSGTQGNERWAGYVTPYDSGAPLFTTLPEVWRRTCIAVAGFMGENVIAEEPPGYRLLSSAHEFGIAFYYAKCAETIFARVTAQAMLRATLTECRTMLQENIGPARKLRDLLLERGELNGEEIADCLRDVKPITLERWQALMYAGGGEQSFPDIEAALPIADALALGVPSYSNQMAVPELPKPLSELDPTERAVFMFSGGKESMVLSHMLQPYRDRITMVWTNTGAMFPHMVEFVRQHASTAGFQYVELNSNQAARFATAGLPTKIIPVFNSREGIKLEPHPAGRVMLTDWRNCCSDLRTRPVWQWMQMHGVRTVIHGQRQADNVASWIQAPLINVAPLDNWSEADVYAYINAHTIELPIQYATGYGDSGECLNCPAELGADRIAWIKRAYPERMPELRLLVGAVAGAVRAEIDKAQSGVAELLRP